MRATSIRHATLRGTTSRSSRRRRRSHRRQRRGMRILDEGIRGAVPRRPRVGRARPRLQRKGARRLGSADGDRRAARATASDQRHASSITTRVTSRTRRACARSRGRCWRRFLASSCCRLRKRRSAAAAPASTISCSRSRPRSSASARRATSPRSKPDIIATGNPGMHPPNRRRRAAARIRLEDRSPDRADRSVNQGRVRCRTGRQSIWKTRRRLPLRRWPKCARTTGRWR